MSGEAEILHADLDAFFASVEQRDDARLRARPVIVGGGVVLAASYEARAFGVRSAMGGAQARRLCPQAIVVRPRFAAYVEASRAVHEIFDAQGIVTVGDIARIGEPALIALLGRSHGRFLHGAAHNHDMRRVRAGRRRGSFGSQRALGRSAPSIEQLDAVLVALVDRVTRRMRRAGQTGRTIVLRLRFADYARATRSRTMARATAATAPLLFTARALLRVASPLIERHGITLLGISVSGLEQAGPVQLTLPFDRDEAALDAVLDDVRERFGTATIRRATLLYAGEELPPWLEPGEGDLPS